MNTNYCLVRQAYEEARERRHLANNHPVSETENREAHKAFQDARQALVLLVEAL